MKTKILFIAPPQSCNSRAKFTNHQVPMGFIYMAGLLEKKGFEVKILDCPLYYKKVRKIDEETIKFGLFPEEIEEQVKSFDPDIVGISCSFTMFEPDSFEVIDLIKKIDKKIIVVVGGAHTSSNTEYVLRNKNIDLAVVGEGELTMLEIAERFRSNKKMDNILGTALIKNNKFKLNPPREYIKDLDSLEPAWHFLDLNNYFEHPDNSEVAIRGPSINIITSRGCPGNCIFCSVHTVWGRKWRFISSKKVVDQIELLYKDYGVRHFRINDDNLTLDKKRIIDICKEIIKRKIDIKWDTPSGVALWTLDKEVIGWMKKSGYYRITFGIESGSKNTLKYIGKNIDLNKTKGLIEYCHKVGLWVASFFIVGFPYETKEDINLTKEYILESGINFPFIFLAQPYPGTRLYEDFLKGDLMKKGYKDTSTFITTKYESKNFSAEELNSLRARLYRDFYLMTLLRYSNPFNLYREFLSKIKTREDLRYVFKILKSLFTSFIY